MPNAASILHRKGDRVVTARADITVLEAARIMNQHRIGCVVIIDDIARGRIAGILTERDILTRVVAAERDPSRTLVRDVMTSSVHTCARETPTPELRALMQRERIRHVPVRDADGTLAGLVSIGDVNAMDAEELSATIVVMEQYITRG